MHGDTLQWEHYNIMTSASRRGLWVLFIVLIPRLIVSELTGNEGANNDYRGKLCLLWYISCMLMYSYPFLLNKHPAHMKILEEAASLNI